MPKNNSRLNTKQQIVSMNGLNLIPIPINSTISSKPMNTVIQEPEIQKTQLDIDSENSRFLASLLGQGVAMIGAGIAGRDPGRVADQISDMRLISDRQKETQRQQEEAIKQSQDLMNPQSEISKRQRMLYGKILGNIPENVSASDLKDPVVLQGLREQQIKLQTPKGGIAGGVRQAQVKPEKESKEQKELDEFTSQAESLKESLQDYRKAIKDIPLTGGAAQKEKAKTLGRSLLLKMKTVENTGSLDAGSISVIEDIIGSPDYTRDNVVDSKIDQALMMLNRNVESKTRGINGLNKKYKPFIPFEANEMDAQIINNYFNNPNDPNYIELYNKLRKTKGF